MIETEAPSIAVVTGAARGIGREIAAQIAAGGRTVVALDRDEAALVETVAALRSKNLSVEGRVCDVADAAAIAAAFEFVASLPGRLDVLVDNAGIVRPRAALDVSAAEWQDVLAVNLTGAFLCSQAAARAMMTSGGGGRIVLLSSHSASLGSRDRAAYAASKGGLEALARVLAVEWAEFGITVNAVAPGPVETPHVQATHDPRRRAAWLAALPIRRYAEPAEIAAAVMYLVSPQAACVTGQVLRIDGGFTAVGLI